jgi:hypothetical protein
VLPDRRLTQDPDVMADPAARRPVEETLAWVRARLAEILTDGLRRGELEAALDPASSASTIVAVLQGGYVLARAANSTAPFTQAVEGVTCPLSAPHLSDLPHGRNW